MAFAFTYVSANQIHEVSDNTSIIIHKIATRPRLHRKKNNLDEIHAVSNAIFVVFRVVQGQYISRDHGCICCALRIYHIISYCWQLGKDTSSGFWWTWWETTELCFSTEVFEDMKLLADKVMLLYPSAVRLMYSLLATRCLFQNDCFLLWFVLIQKT